MEKGRIDMRRYAVTWAAVLFICFHLASGQVRNQAPRFTGQLALRVVKTAPVGTTTLTTLNAVDTDGPSPVNIYISDFATRQLVQLKTVPGLRSSRSVVLASSLAAEPPSTKSLYIVASDGSARTTATITLQVINPVSPILTGLNTTGLISNPPDVQTVTSNLQLLTNTICDLYTNQSPASGSISRLRLFCLLFKAVYSQLPPSIFNSSETIPTTPVPDVNKPPVFTGPTSFTVRGNLPAGSQIGRLTAVDGDGPRAIAFNIRDLQNTGRFDLRFASGQSSSGRVVSLFLRQSLDSETTPREVLFVTADDGLATSTATVIVNVLSLDNNPPTFIQRNWTFIVGNSSLPGVKIGTVLSLDRDSGNNGRVSYSFRAVNSSMETFFSMNNFDGSLYLKRPLQGNRNVTLIVTAVDGGGLKATAIVTVLVRASNGNTSNNTCGNSTCLNGGRCVRVGNRNYTCVCSSGFTGVNCTYRNSSFGCLSNPCLNGGYCSRGVNNSYRCFCRSGFTGFNCATRNTSNNTCGNSTCLNGGRCVRVGNRNYTCVCSSGFTGVNCTYRNSSFGCLSNPCLNGGYCSRGVNNSYRCFCRSGFTGFNCATRNTSNNTCGNSTCLNGGRCVRVGNRNYTCVCSSGFTGVNCTYRNSSFGCLSNPCLNGGYCSRGVNNSYRCFCRSGFTGFNCATRNTSNNTCGNSTCLNGGRCVRVGNRNYTCVCSSGFTGVNCTYRNSSFGCLSNPCLNGGYCSRGVNNSYRCFCRSGFTGFNCATRNTSNNTCGNSTCLNGGRCVRVGNRNYTCVCSSGFTGVNCTYRNSSFGCLSNPCLNGGYCSRGVNNSYRCFCRSGFTGFNCATRNTSNNTCGNSTCLNGGRCVRVGNRNYTCVCSSGFTGVNCTYRNSSFGCLSNPCLNGGYCSRGVNNSYRCFCRSGFTGFNCATRNTSNNTCGNSTCLNGGRCVRVGNRNYTCVCSSGFTGVNCTYRNSSFGCLSNPCLNGGYCSRGVNNSYRCFCRSGFTGFNCATRNTSNNTCGNSTCLNGGRCVRVGNRNYTCVCSSGFTGVNCTYRNSSFGCLSNPCLNGGSCSRGVNNSYRCFCLSGYSGFNCATRNTSNACGTNPCLNGGTCIDRGNGVYSCLCSQGLSGVNCGNTGGTSTVNATTVRVSEDAPIGTQLLRINVPSVIGPVSVSSTDTTGTISTRLSLFGSSGTIIVTLGRSLDRESVDRMEFTIYAGGPVTRISKKLILNITDVNDNSPVFTSPRAIAVNKATPVGTRIMTVNATDFDAGQNGNVSYSIYGGTQGANRFRLNRTSGVLSVNGSLATLSADTVTLNVQARDNGFPRLISTATISIRLTNSETPVNSSLRFQPSVYSTSVMESTPRGSFLAQLALVDLNQRLVGRVVSIQDLTNTVYADDFIINNDVTYVSLRLSQTLDREISSSLTVIVIAATKAPPFISATCTVAIQVVDVNDNSPVFQSPRYTATIASGAPVGSMVAVVSATDSDIGRAAQVSYRFQQTSTEFTINANTGMITTLATLSLSANTVRNMVVLAQDNGTPPLSSTALVEIQITGQPDNGSNTGPVFDSSQVFVTVVENQPANTIITRLTARDPNGGISFIMPEDANSLFALQQPTGINGGSSIPIVATRSLDREITPQYLLLVVASDGRLQATATVTVQVQDVNDNAPFFSQRLYSSNISASYQVGSMILQTRATDADIGNNGLVTYRKQANTAQDLSGVFQVESSSGRIIQVASLANLAGRTVNFTVTATDNGTPSLTSTANVTIRVVGVVPDNGSNTGPVFDRSQVFVTVVENQPANTIITSLTARHPNGGQSISFSMPEDANSIFALQQPTNTNSGSSIPIVSAATLDREVTPQYLLLVVASDGRLQATATVTVQVQDVNDNAPVFSQRLYSSSIPDSYQVGSIILQTRATDADIGNNGLVTYRKQATTAQDLSGVFQVESSSGRIIQVASLANLAGRTVNFTVIATDNGTPPLTSTANVTIRVVGDDENQSPVIRGVPSTINIPENTQIGSVLFVVGASDSDGPNRLTFSLPDRESFDTVQIGGSAGNGTIMLARITLNTFLNRELEQTKVFRIVASDGLNAVTSTVTIVIEDVNDNPPTFTSSSYSSTVSKSVNVGTSVLTVAATDPDQQNNGTVQYSVQSSTVPGYFSVDQNTGVISVVNSLSSLADGQMVTLRVEARDKGIPLSLNASVLVRIVIQSSPVTVANNVAPTFSQQNMSFTVRENNINGTFIGTIRATDLDGPRSLTMRVAGDTASNGASLVRALTNGQVVNNDYTFYLLINTVFDRERDPVNNTVLLIASDGVAETTATVMITVEDLNDNSPVFTQSTYTATVQESLPVNSRVIQVAASDADSGLFGEITYTMASNDPVGNQVFRIDGRTGTIVTASSLLGMSGQVANVGLTVTATDGGRRSSTAAVSITIL